VLDAVNGWAAETLRPGLHRETARPATGLASKARPMMSALILVCFFLYLVLTVISLFWSDRK
jgi:hypothetical protein